MVEQNENEQRSVNLDGILEDYATWFSTIATSVAYFKTNPLPEGFSLPLSFREWISSNQNNTEINSQALKSLSNAHYSMRVASEKVIASLFEDGQPSYKDFVEFKEMYNNFLSQIANKEELVKFNPSEDSILDGIRPMDSLKEDIDREMERLARNGNPFVIACARIDSFSKLNDQDTAFSVTKSNIIKSMRPFDDVYYLGDGEFLLSLKHTDVVGGEVALVRIQRSMELDEENTMNFSVSCCLAEPVTGEEIASVIKNMRDDLDNHKNDAETILKFLDISPLERFIGSKK